MRTYYKNKFHKPIDFIPFGYFKKKSHVNQALLKKYKLEHRNYFVWVGRLAPENFLEEFLKAFIATKGSKTRCIILGDDLYDSPYKDRVYKLMRKDARIIHAGFINNTDVISLVAGSLAYIETKRSGGTHVSLVEAMGTGTLIVSNRKGANKQILGNAALFYNTVNDLTRSLRLILDNPEKYSRLGDEARKRAEKGYSWKNIIKSYELLFKNAI
jgi:rhamnosyltransferase